MDVECSCTVENDMSLSLGVGPIANPFVIGVASAAELRVTVSRRSSL
jgi:hypothetical protein